ncbi:MAG TPA: two-component sensor histidine kinase [Clostridiales bacterium]|nr:two-component sensor histidine kinase [Clostridiales bacterium]
MKRDRISIKWKLYAYLAGFVILTLLILWLLQIRFLEDFYKAIKISEIKSAAEMLRRNINDPDLDTLVTSLSENDRVTIRIFQASGKELVSSYTLPDYLLNRVPPQDILKYLQIVQNSGGAYLERFSMDTLRPPDRMEDGRPGKGGPQEIQRLESILYLRTATLKDGTEVMIMLGATISPVTATVRTLRVQLLLVTGILLVLALGLALLLSRKISRPIIHMNASAKELGKGRYGIHFQSHGYREITELGETLNHTARELSKLDALRRELIANVSHDLRTPLTMIIGYAEVMRDLPGENTPENIQIIINEAKWLTGLVNDMLDLSRLQSGTLDLKMSTFNLTLGIRNILDRIQKMIGQEGYRIRFIHDQEVTVYADGMRISQVIYNLVINALSFTGADRSVLLRQKVQGDRVRIEVIDTGEGIPEAMLNKIWERYSKVGKSRGKPVCGIEGGTGLGLSIVRSILDLHNGMEPGMATYGAESTPGQGSIFWFELKTTR